MTHQLLYKGAKVAKIQVAILGYGNLGRGVELAINKNSDMELVAIFSRRDSVETAFNTPVIGIDEILNYKEKIDVLILCGGSKSDLPEQTPKMAEHFNTIDSFDTHANILEYMATIEPNAKKGNKLAIIANGWDPGMFSLNRLYSEAVLSDGATYTFWGKGLSQGHSDAIRRVAGVKAGVQYTIPSVDAMNRAKSGSRPELTTKEKHKRECFVVLENGADKEAVREAIVTMPNYFADYETTVNFINEDELKQNHNKMPHGGFVIRSGSTSQNHNQVIEYSLKLDSNPEFTASVLVAFARAAHKMHKMGTTGVVTPFDVPPILLSDKSRESLIRELL